MSISSPRIVRAYTQTVRRLTSDIQLCRTPAAICRQIQPGLSRRQESTITAPPNPKISHIVDEISQLTLLETADLVSNLKTRLNIPDMPMGSFSTGFGSGNATSAPLPAEEEEEAAPAAQEKTLFTLTLKSIDSGTKPKIIKEIKSMLGLSLVDSKKFVESAPKQMKDGVPKEEAEKLIEMMKGIGAVVAMD